MKGLKTQTVDMVQGLSRILVRSLRELGERGGTEQACELAAEAWSLLRDSHAKEAERMNGLLHQLTSTKCSSGNKQESNGDYDLEVRHLPPAQRHDLILESYQKLQDGQGFILINDHDPKPLYYQFAYEYPDQFTWTPVESGPEVWRVRVGKPAMEAVAKEGVPNAD